MTTVSLSALERQLVGARAFADLPAGEQSALEELKPAQRTELYDKWRPSWQQITEALGSNPLAAFVSAVHEVRPDLVVRAVFGAAADSVSYVEVIRSADETVRVGGFDRYGRGDALEVTEANGETSPWSGDAKGADELARNIVAGMTPAAQVDPESKRPREEDF